MSANAAGKTTITTGFSRIARSQKSSFASKADCDCLCHQGAASHLEPCVCVSTSETAQNTILQG
jgi:hypothetical protein